MTTQPNASSSIQSITGLRTDPLDLSRYEALYKHFHSHPELSTQESATATTVIKHLHALSTPSSPVLDVTGNIGGHGIAAVCSNGGGPTVLLRADMDALPVEEKTGLDYASKIRMVDVDRVEKPVMHACGHDMHVTCLLAATEHLMRIHEKWSGTLIVVFQPNEERAGGARAMVEGGLYEKVPVPDVVLGQHVMPGRAGTVTCRKGTAMAAADSFRVTVFGRGGHGSGPHTCVDPVVLAANVVVRLQGIVSREIDPADVAVVTVGSIQAGETVGWNCLLIGVLASLLMGRQENVISDRAVLRINVRSQKKATREKVLSSIRRIIHAECDASASPKEPLIEETTSFPLTVNDEDIADQLGESFGTFFKEDFASDKPASNASEDVSILATSVRVPCCFWFFGGTDQEKWDLAERNGKLAEDIPTNHSSYFAPVIQPTMRIGVEALCVAALTFLQKAQS